MRLSALLFLLLLSSGIRAQTPAQAAYSDFRVVGAFLVLECSDMHGNSYCPQVMRLRVEDGQHSFELKALRPNSRSALLALGNYKARLVIDEHSKPFLSSRVYELLYPDGSTERFDVVGEFTLRPGNQSSK